MNPWRINVFELCRKVVRLALWLAFVLNMVMLAIFSIVFVYHFLTFFWRFLRRTLFGSEW